MNGRKALIALAISAFGVLGTTSAGWSFFDGRHHRGGFVKPCSLDGVNPVYHPRYFRQSRRRHSLLWVCPRAGPHVVRASRLSHLLSLPSPKGPISP
jgi:hypothetical protein